VAVGTSNAQTVHIKQRQDSRQAGD